MSSSKVYFIPLHREAIIPKTHTLGAAGYDINSVYDEVIPAFSTLNLKLGFSLKIPPHLFGYLLGRSGIARNYGVSIINSYVKDEEEVSVTFRNFTAEPFVIEKGARLAQIFFAVIDDCRIEEINKQD